MNDSVTNLDNCADEPIRIPGSVQPHGIYVAVDDAWSVRQISANVSEHLEATANDLLGVPLTSLLQPDRASAMVEVIDQARSGYMNPLRINLRNGRIYDGIVHTNQGLTVVELESTEPSSSPDLGSTASVIDPYFTFVQSAFAHIRESIDLPTACRGVAELLRDFIRFDRVLFYQFDQANHGEVIAESVVDDLEPFLGLHFPESDIPSQARELYTSNLIRTIGDAAYEPSPLVPQKHPLTGEPTDLSNAVLRSVSPIHREYLRNMGVGSSMSLSILDGDRLWGLISCHHREARHLPYTTRAACVMLSTVVSGQLVAKRDALLSEAVSKRRRTFSRVLSESAKDEDLTRSIERTAHHLLALFEADGVAFWLRELVTSDGMVPEEGELERLVAWLSSEGFDEVQAWHQLSMSYPSAEDLSPQVAGLLSIPLGFRCFLFLFRKPQSDSVRWAGDPSKAKVAEGGRLRPRASFKEWREVVQRQSRPWSPETLSLATELRNALSQLIIARNQKLTELNESLDAKNKEIEQFAYTISHDLRSPLVSARGFFDFLKTDLEAGAEGDWRDSLTEIGIAIDQMGSVLDDLLEYSTIGKATEQPSLVDLRRVVDEVLRMHEEQAKELGVTIEIGENLPACWARERQLRRAIDNLLGNALKYGASGSQPTISITGLKTQTHTEITISDNGDGIAPQHHEKIFDLFQRLDPEQPGTGLGLASVKKVAELHGGTVRVESAPGHGASFTISLPSQLH